MIESLATSPARHGVLVRTRVPLEMKLRLTALARKRGVNQAALMRQLIANALAESRPEHGMKFQDSSVDQRGRRDLSVELNAADRRALRKLAAARNVRVSRYLSALVRSHVKDDQRPLAAEMAMMRDLIDRLNGIRVELNHLVRAANEGVVWTEALRELLEQNLRELERLGLKLAEFGAASRQSLRMQAIDAE